MKKLLVIFSLSLGSVLMAQCTPKAAKAVAETPSATPGEASVTYSADQLNAGKMIFTGNCAKCHGIKEPETRTAAQWDKILNRMIPKAKLNEADGKLVRAYVMAHAKQG